MTNHFLHLAAPGVRKLNPYEPGLPLAELERRYGVRDAIKLASNENPLGPGPRALMAIHTRFNELARYPDGNGFELKQALAVRHDVELEQITIGNGSNDVLELLARGFLTPADEVLFSEHAFAVYGLVTQAVGARAVVAPARNWGHDLEAMAAAITERTRLIFIANPNNPTGTWLGSDELAAFVARVPEHALLVIDEAYFEYASDPDLGVGDYPDSTQWMADHPNLVVTRTFSKAYGLAGLRVGYALSHPGVADILNRVRQPFNVDIPGLAAACAALEDSDHLVRTLAVNREGMADLYQGLETLDLGYIPSAGNFVAVDVGQPAGALYEKLLREGVIVRPVAGYGMPNHLRVTIGLPDENQRFLEALRKVLGR